MYIDTYMELRWVLAQLSGKTDVLLQWEGSLHDNLFLDDIGDISTFLIADHQSNMYHVTFLDDLRVWVLCLPVPKFLL